MKKVVIIGAGPSGLAASIYASKNNRVILLEKNSDIGKKLSITGNGRCNYYNDDMNINHFHSESLTDISKIINEKNLKKVKDFYNKIGIIPKIKNGYYYPYSNQASSFISALKSEIERRNIEIKTNFNVINIEKKDKYYIYSENEVISADILVIASGSKSYPKTGSDGFGYEVLNKFNLNIIKPLPALSPLVTNAKFIKKLSGVRVDTKLDLYENDKYIKSEIGELLITDYGISGICTFNLSGKIKRGLENNTKEDIILNFVHMLNISSKSDFINYLDERNEMLGDRKVYELFDGFINYKIVNFFLQKYKDKKWNKLKREEKDEVATLFYSQKINIIDTKSFDKSQTCSGGLDFNELNLDTFETKKIKDLYVAGELLDIYGDCGGYNLTLAFLSGILIGENIC